MNPEEMEDSANSSSHLLSRGDPKVCPDYFFYHGPLVVSLMRFVVLASSDQIWRFSQHLCFRVHWKHVRCGSVNRVRPARTRPSRFLRKIVEPDRMGGFSGREHLEHQGKDL